MTIAADLLTALRRDSGLDLAYASPPTALGGGFWAELLAFRLDGAPAPWAGELVAKITPSRRLGEREALVQSRLADAGYCAPPVLLQGEAANGGWYFVMPKVAGAPPLAAASPGALIRSVPKLAVRLPGLLADLAVRLHSADAAPLQGELSARPGWPVGIDDLVSDMTAAADALSDQRTGDAVRKVIAARPSESTRNVICHGDFHPINVVVDGSQATVVDWTAARIAPPAFDVAFTALLLSRPPIEVDAKLRAPLDLAGRWLSHRFVRAYRRRARWTLPSEELDWFTRLHAARILLDVSQHADGPHPFQVLADPARELLGLDRLAATRHAQAGG